MSTPRAKIVDTSAHNLCAQYQDVIDEWGLVGVYDDCHHKINLNKDRHKTIGWIAFGYKGSKELRPGYMSPIFRETEWTLHRIGGPARIRFHADGKIRTEEYWQNNRLHRENGPAVLEYEENGDLSIKTYYIDGERHRIGGPARITYLSKLNKHRRYAFDISSTGINLNYYLHNVLVGRKFAMRPHEQTLRKINNEANAEVKRLRIQYYGWDRYLHDMDAHVVDLDIDDISQTNQSLLYCISGRDHINVLLCACPSTARLYATEVPLSIFTCKQAQAWLKGDRLATANIIGAS